MGFDVVESVCESLDEGALGEEVGLGGVSFRGLLDEG